MMVPNLDGLFKVMAVLAIIGLVAGIVGSLWLALFIANHIKFVM